MQVSRMCHGKGYVSLFTVEPLQTVPLDVEQLLEFMVLLSTVVQAKVSPSLLGMMGGC